MKKTFYLLLLTVVFSCNHVSKKTASTEASDNSTLLSKADSNSDAAQSAKSIDIPILRIDQCNLMVYVTGDHKDLIYFSKNGTKIGVDPIRDGDDLNYPHGSYDNVWNGSDWNSGCLIIPCTGLDVKGINVGDICYVSVRHGKYRDLVFYYAVVGNQVYRSKKWQEGTTEHPEYGVAVTHAGNKIEIKGYPFSEDNGHFGNPTNISSFGIFSFDPSSKEFDYQIGNNGSFRECDACIARVLASTW